MILAADLRGMTRIKQWILSASSAQIRRKKSSVKRKSFYCTVAVIILSLDLVRFRQVDLYVLFRVIRGFDLKRSNHETHESHENPPNNYGFNRLNLFWF